MAIHRRAAIRIGSAAFGLSLAPLLGRTSDASPRTGSGLEAKAPTPAKAKSVVVLYLSGGPSQLDMWDMKPEAPEAIRGSFRPIATNVPGTFLSEHLPRMARIADQCAIVRSMSHDETDHVKAAYWTMTGHRVARRVAQATGMSRADRPHLGAMISRMIGPVSNLPPFVIAPEFISPVGVPRPGQNAGFLGAKFDPHLVALSSFAQSNQNGESVSLSLGDLPEPERLARRRSLLDHQNERLAALEAAKPHGESLIKAFDLLSSPQALQAFDLSQESPRTLERYGASHSFGRSALLARRLIEAGVRLVQVNFVRHDRGEGGQGYDSHSGPPSPPHLAWCKDVLFPPTDAAFSSLVEDLRDRGLLDETLVIMMGEFGRTPKFNSNGGRDHWSKCYSLIAAGGGLRAGIVHGASDRSAAYPLNDPVSIPDLFATVYHLLGIDPNSWVRDPQNRPLAIIEGAPVAGLIA